MENLTKMTAIDSNNNEVCVHVDRVFRNEVLYFQSLDISKEERDYLESIFDKGSVFRVHTPDMLIDLSVEEEFQPTLKGASKIAAQITHSIFTQ